MGRGKKGNALDRSDGSTILSHMRSGMFALRADVKDDSVEAGTKATADEAIIAVNATVVVIDFMVDSSVRDAGYCAATPHSSFLATSC